MSFRLGSGTVWYDYEPGTGPPVSASVAAAMVTAGTMTDLTATILE
jgi:hypothetical protein